MRARTRPGTLVRADNTEPTPIEIATKAARIRGDKGELQLLLAKPRPNVKPVDTSIEALTDALFETEPGSKKAARAVGRLLRTMGR